MTYPSQSQPFDPNRPPDGQDPSRTPGGTQPPLAPGQPGTAPGPTVPGPTAPGGGDRSSAPPERSAAEPFIVDEGEYRPRTDDTTDSKEEAKRVASGAADRSREVADTAKQEASAVAETARAEGGHVIDSAKEEAGHVVDEAKFQTRRILDEGVGELKQQAEVGQRRLAEVVRSMSGELHSMTDSTDESGPVVEFAGRVQRFGDDAADWLEQNRPEEVLESVRRFAARRPWTFLAISAGVGFVGARLVRGLSDGDDSGSAGHRGERRLGAPSYSDDVERLGRGSQPLGGPPPAQSIRGDHVARPDDRFTTPPPAPGARGGELR